MPDEKPRLIRPEDLREELLNDADALYRALQEGKPIAPPTPFRRLNALLGGGLMPGLHVLHGMPGTGKSALCLQIAAHCGMPTLYLTAELSPVELLRRLCANITSTPLGEIKRGMPRERLTEILLRTVKAVPLLAFTDATRARVTPNDLEQLIIAVHQLKRDAPMLLVVDSVHSWVDSFNDADVTEYERLGAAIDDLNGIANRHQLAILAITERNRFAMRTGGLSASAGTRKFEFRAESVWSLQIDGEPARGEKVTPMTLQVEKNRSGALDRIDLLFEGQYQRFREA